MLGLQTRDGRTFLLQRASPARQHLKPSGLKGHACERGTNSRAEHPRNLLGSDRLCTIGCRPSPHAPTCHRDPNSPPRQPTCRFCDLKPNNQLIDKVLQKGDAFVFPVGLVHFQCNVGYGKAISISALSSQNPGVITIANAVFGSKPAIEYDVLAKAFQVDNSIVNQLQAQF